MPLGQRKAGDPSPLSFFLLVGMMYLLEMIINLTIQTTIPAIGTNRMHSLPSVLLSMYGIFSCQMAYTEKWNKIKSAFAQCGAVDERVIDLLAGLGNMPLSESAEKVKEAMGVVRTYVTRVHAVVADAEKKRGFLIVKSASGAKDALYRAVEGVRDAMDAVKRTSKEMAESSSADPDAIPIPNVKDAAECVSIVMDAMKKADGAANSASAVVALATEEALRAVNNAPDMTARMEARDQCRASVSPLMIIIVVFLPYISLSFVGI